LSHHIYRYAKKRLASVAEDEDLSRYIL